MNKLSRLFPILLLFITAIAIQGQSTDAKFKKPELRPKQQAISQAPEKWYTFTGPDGDFIIGFPSKPRREEDTLGLVAAIRHYSTTTATYYFAAMYEDVGPEVSDLKPGHEEALSALLRERGHKIVSVRRLSKNVSQIELWSPSRTPGRFLHRIDRTIVSHDRMYTLSCASRVAEQEVDKAVCRRFFNSFRIIGTP